MKIENKEIIKTRLAMLSVFLLCSVLFLLIGCTDRSNLVTNSITGTLTKVILKDDKVELTFSGDGYAIITATNIDSDGTNWCNVLTPHIGEKIKLTWIANYVQTSIAYVEYIGDQMNYDL